jgi:hypothetical protein
MPVQNARLLEVTAKGEARSESSGMTAPSPRPAAVDAIRWAATLLTQLGLDPDASKRQRRAA